METTAERIANVAELQALVRETQTRLLPRGGCSKPALSTAQAGVTTLNLDGLSGMTEYDASEYTFTALAATPLAEIAGALAANGQGLPFDPPLAEQGATLGGTIAAGLSGPRRWRFGGLRDFILGVRFVDGRGRLVRGGGKVVKNAAGFDLPKLLVGSLGRLGILTEATFKVFPSPPAFATLRVPCASLAAAQTLLGRIATTPLELEAADLTLSDEGPVLHLRLGGMANVMDERMARLRAFVGDGAVMEGEADFWRGQNGFAWAAPSYALAKVPMKPQNLLALDSALAQTGARRSYSVGGNLAWVAWPGDVGALDALLRAEALTGLLLRGEASSPLLGRRMSATTMARVKNVLDPERRFLDF